MPVKKKALIRKKRAPKKPDPLKCPNCGAKLWTELKLEAIRGRTGRDRRVSLGPDYGRVSAVLKCGNCRYRDRTGAHTEDETTLKEIEGIVLKFHADNISKHGDWRPAGKRGSQSRRITILSTNHF